MPRHDCQPWSWILAKPERTRRSTSKRTPFWKIFSNNGWNLDKVGGSTDAGKIRELKYYSLLRRTLSPRGEAGDRTRQIQIHLCYQWWYHYQNTMLAWHALGNPKCAHISVKRGGSVKKCYVCCFSDYNLLSQESRSVLEKAKWFILIFEDTALSGHLIFNELVFKVWLALVVLLFLSFCFLFHSCFPISPKV